MDTTIAEVLRLIKENPQITRKVLSETIGIASSAIQKHINRLKAEGVIRRVGGDYGGYSQFPDTRHKKRASAEAQPLLTLNLIL